MTRTNAAELRPLATYWMPPRDVGEPIACLASTYTFHAALFEDELLPRFLGLRFDLTEKERVFVAEREDRLATVTAAVFVDAAHVDGRQTTGRWSQVPVRVPSGCQHSKVTVLVWEQMIRVIVSSANLTTSGYRRNREIAACLDFSAGEDSAPRKLLKDVLDFFEEELIELGQMPPGTKARLAEAIRGTRQRARSWNLPEATASLPTATFIPVTPKRDGNAGRGVIGPLIDAWGSKSATAIGVMTPFVGDSPAAVKTTLKELLRIPRVRDAEGYLILGGRPSEERKNGYNVVLPDWFRDEWVKAWKVNADDVPTFVIPPKRAGEKVDRALHAKSIVVWSDDRTLVLIGSSNLSPHGLGIGVFNLEANICYVAREKSHADALYAALPVDWDTDRQYDVQWPSVQETLPDDPPPNAPAPPVAFSWATFDEQSGTLSVAIDASQLPDHWSLWLPGGAVAIFDSARDEREFDGGMLELTLSDAVGARRITYVTIRWVDKSGASQEARLPTLVNEDSELLPAEGLRSLVSEDIVTCLLSGKDPVEWADDDESGDERNTRKKGEKTFDPLKAIDTDSYVLYRTRRLGRALAALSQRILTTLRTQTAIRHRLEADPVGPLMLARAIAAEGAVATGPARAATLFALVELTLTLSYVSLRVDPKGKLNLRAIFDGVRRAIDELAKPFEQEVQPVDPLKRYVASVRKRCEIASTEGLHAG